MSSTSSKPSRINPFPGLRPFTQEEDYLFFGREEQTMELLQRLSSSRFVAVVGTSGSGKSSLVRCGLLSELLGGRMLEAGSLWEIAVTHPGGNPLAVLTDALLDADLYDREVEHTRENLLATLSRSHFGLVEAVKQSDVGEGTNFLLVVDQFEEIFRFQDAGQRQQEVANEFVSLLLEAVSQKEVPIYVVLTMRSDFIGECGQFEGLAEMVNRGEFLIPRLTREQYKRVIEGPIKVAGGKISPRLLQRLLNDLGQQSDQLPCLQHALMRTWNVWAEKGDADELDLDDYQRVGRMSQALSLHADEIFESLASDRQRDLCRGLFQALTVEESNNRGIRRPQRLGRLCQILEVTADELQPIIDAYRHSGVTFLMPSPEVDLTEQTIIDISHESLMRVWTRLRHWVEEEAQAVGIYRRLSESAGLHAEGKAGLYRDPELGIALAWREEMRPNQAWAERYRPGFQQAIEYLERSHQAQVADEQAHEVARQRELEQAQQLAEAQKQRLEQQQRAAQKMRRLLAGLAVVAVVAVSACFVALAANNRANRLATLANEAANEARQNAQKAELSSEDAEQSMRQAVASEQQAQQAEQRSREFRYATDMQLAATLVADKTTNANQVLARLSDHDPEENQELAGKDDLRGFEWHYLKRLVEGQSVVFKGFDKEVVAIALNSEGEVITLDGDSRIQHWDAATRQETRPSRDLRKNRIPSLTALAPDGRRAALAIGNQVHLVDALTGDEVPGTIPAQARSKLLFSPDSRMLITVDTGIGWWNAATGEPIAVQDFKLSAFGPEFHPVSISADGLTVIVGGQGTYRTSLSVFKLNPESREIVQLQTIGTTGTKRAAAISPDGAIVAVSLFFAGDLQLFDVATGTPLPTRSNAHSASISAIAFSPDGTRLMTSAMDGSVRVWDDYRQIATSSFTPLLGHPRQVNSITFLSDGKRFATVGIDKSVRLWDMEQQSVSRHRSVAGAIGPRARFSPDGTLMAVSGDTTRLQLRDGRTGQVVISLPDRSDQELASDSVAFSPDNRLLAAGFGGKANVSYIELWDIDRREMLAVLPGATEIPGYAVNEYSSLISGLSFSPDGKYLVAGFGSMSLISSGDQGNFPLLVYDVTAQRMIRRLEGHRNFSLSVTFSRDGSRLASASNDGTARLWDTANWKEVLVLNNPDPLTDRGGRRVTDVAFSPDGKRLAMASAEGNVIIYNGDTGEQLQTLRGHANEVSCVAFSPDGRTLASGSADRSVRLWNTATWRELVRLEPEVDFLPEALEFSSDGRCLLAASLRGEALIWTTEPAAEETGPMPENLKAWRASGDRFQSYIRGESEVAQLREALETFSAERAEDPLVQTALAAVRANWYASRQEWKLAVEQFHQMKQLSPAAPAAWWYRPPGIFRLATALFHEDRPVDAALLLHDSEHRNTQETPGTQEVRALDVEVVNRWQQDLLASVSRKLKETPNHPGLLELQAELYGSAADPQKKIASYTAAIEALEQQTPSPTADLQRLYSRRGNTYVSLKQWQQAVDDYARGITQETTDHFLLSSQALAKSAVRISEVAMEASIQFGREDVSHGVRLVNGIEDGVTEPETFKGEECRLIRMTQGYGHAYFIIESDFKWSPRMDVEIEMQYRDEGITSLSLQYDAHDSDYSTARQVLTSTDDGNWKTARFELKDAQFAGSQNAGSDFRVSVAGYRFYIKQLRIRQLRFGNGIESPWVRLAAAHLARKEQAEIDQLVERRPEIAGPVGDLFTDGEDKDFQRAVEIYSKAITPESTDDKLLARRARAYEELKDYNAAARDWTRVAGENPQGAKLLMEFAQRLIMAEQRELAAIQQQRTRQVLEAVLQSDPDDAPAVERLAQLLLDPGNSQSVWTTLQPAESTTAGVPIRPLPNNSALLETSKKYTLTFPVAEHSWKMVRIETSPESAPSANDARSFSEYHLISTDLPAEGVSGRYVRIDLPGDNSLFPRYAADFQKKILTLAEVQVFQKAGNIARTGNARQSSTGWGGIAARAIDGNVDGDWWAGASTHTDDAVNSDPWWELDLGSEQPLERVVVWNRTDVKYGIFANRLNHFRVQILDASRHIKYEEVIDDAPNPSREILLNKTVVSRVPPDATEKEKQWQVSVESQFAPGLGRRMRFSVTEDQPMVADTQTEQGQVIWSAVRPSQVTSASSQAVTIQDDGTVVAEESFDSLPLGLVAETVKAVRVETAALSGESPAFHEYRIQAVDAATAESRAILGRYVRLDLPGDSAKFPRMAKDGDKKCINLAELQVFQGDLNVALRKKVRISSSYNEARFAAENAVDGSTIGNDAGNPYAHTWQEENPWWEVDLGGEYSIDRLVVWNRNETPEIPRMNHFRIRILNLSRDVVFEQVIDEAPHPSREIDCQSLFLQQSRPTAADKPQLVLRLGQDASIKPGQPFRISTAGTLHSIEQEEALIRAGNLPVPAVRLAAAYDFSNDAAASALWFGRALDRADTDQRQNIVQKELQNHPLALEELLPQRGDEISLQLTQARSHVTDGQKQLVHNRPGEALARFQQADDLFTRLLDQNPEPQWIVLEPNEMNSRGGATLTVQPDGSILASGKNPDLDAYTVSAHSKLERITAIRLEVLPDPSLSRQGPGRSESGNIYLNGMRVWNNGQRLGLSEMAVSFSEFEAFQNVLRGVANQPQGWSVYPRVGERQTAVFVVDPLSETMEELKFEFFCARDFSKQENLGRFRLSVTDEPHAFMVSRFRMKLPDSERKELDIAIGIACAQLGRHEEAAVALAKALDRVQKDDEQKTIIEQFLTYPVTLTILAAQRPRLLPLQLAVAKQLAEEGKKSLAENQQQKALPQLAEARGIFSRLAADYAEPTWTVLQPTQLRSEGGAELTQEGDGSIFVSGANPDRDSYLISAPLKAGSVGALRLEVIPDDRLPGRGAGRSDGAGEFLLAEIEVLFQGSTGEESPLAIRNGYASFSRDGQYGQPIWYAYDSNLETPWGVLPRLTDPHLAVFAFDQLEATPQDSGNIIIRLKVGSDDYPRRNLGRFRLSVATGDKVVEAVRFHQELNSSGLADLETSLGKAHAQQGRTEDAATSFSQALDLASNRDLRMKILKEASAHAGVIEQLAKQRADEPAFHDLLARYYQLQSDFPNAVAAAAKARELYEQRLAAEPANFRIAKDLADLLLDVHPVEALSRKWTILKPTEMNSRGGATLTLLDDGSILAGGFAPNVDVYTITTHAGLPKIQAFLLEAIPHETLPLGSSGRRSQDGDFALTEFKVAQSSADHPGTLTSIPLTLAICDYSQPDMPIKNAIDGNDGTWWDILPHIHQPHYAAFSPAVPLTMPTDGILTFSLEFKLNYGSLGLGRFRLSVTDDPATYEREKSRLLAQKIENPWIRLGAAYHSLDEFDKAFDRFVQAITLAGTDSAKAAAAQQGAAFEDVFARLLERFPDDKPLRLGQAKYVASQQIAEGQFQSAANLLTSIVGDFPDDIELLTLRAEALLKLRQWQAADADYARIIELDSDAVRRRTVERSRAEAQLRSGQFQAAAEGFLQAMFLDVASIDRPREATIAQLLAGNAPVARTTTKKLYDLIHSHTDSGYSWGLTQVFTAQPGLVTNENSPQLLDAAKRAGGVLVEPMTASVHYRLGNLSQAEPLLTIKTEEPMFQALSAMLLFDLGKPEEARQRLQEVDEWFERERARDPGSVIPMQVSWQDWAVRMAVRREAARKLIGPRATELDKSLEKNPDNAAELLKRASLLADAQLLEEAIRDLDRLAALHAESPESQALYGRILVGLNRSEEALPRLNQALEAGLQDAGVYAARGAIHLRRGQTAEAKNDLEKSLALQPTEFAAQSLADLLLAEVEQEIDWTVLSPTEMTSQQGATLMRLEDQSIVASGANPDKDVYTIRFTDLPTRFQILRLEVLPHGSLSGQGPGRHPNGNFVLSEFSGKLSTIAPDAEQMLVISRAFASHEQSPVNADSEAYPIRTAIDGQDDRRGWAILPETGQPQSAVFGLQNAVEGKAGDSLTVSLIQNYGGSHLIGRFRISVTEAPVAILKSAVSALTNSHAKLAAAYFLTGDSENAALLLQKSPEQASILLETWRNSGASVDSILDFLRNRAPDAYAAMLPDAASRAAEQGEIDAARASYSQLVELHPENTMWKERIAQLRPETLAVWNFDTGLGTWDSPNNCELSVRDGVLQVTETAADPHFFGPVAVRSGANALVLRYRREQPFWLEYYCGDALGDVDQSSGMSIYQVPGTEGTWRELLLPLSGRELPNALRLDLNLGTGQTVEIDSIELRHVDTAEYARLAREVVVEPTLARLQAEIDQEPQSAEKYSARATYLMRLGRWREASADARQSRKLEPTNRGKWFSEANCVLLDGDEAAYRQLCQEMIEQFRGTADDEIADSVCKTCVLLPGTIELSELPIQMLRTALDEPQKSAFHNWFLGTAALYAYRDDKYDEAIAWTKRNSSPAGQTGALAIIVRAMAEHRLGQHEHAAQTLAQAEALIPGDLAALGTPDDTTLLPIPVNNVAADWLTPEILRREAATLIFPQSSDPQRPGNRAP